MATTADLIASVRQRTRPASTTGRVVVIALSLLGIAFGVYRLWPHHRTRAEDQMARVPVLMKCSNPDCAAVVEWTNEQVVSKRLRQIQLDMEKGGTGYPAITVPCPKCGHQLVRAERLSTGEVRPLARPTPSPNQAIPIPERTRP